MNTLQRCVPWALALLASACAGPGGGSGGKGGGTRILVALQDYRTGERFELASESHTSRVEYYSSQRDEASRKIQTDEVMDALLEELDRRGFSDHSQPGPAPSVGASRAIRWGLEVESDAGRAHWLVGASSAGDAWTGFRECRDTFLELYNVTVSFQTVQNPGGKQIFQQQAGAAAGERR